MIELLNEDCLQVLRRTPSDSIDLFLQDPPYATTQNKWDKPINFAELWPEWIRVGKFNTPFIFTAAQPFATDLINSNRKLFRYDLIWYKPLGSGHLNANRMPMRNHEYILIFYDKPPVYNPQMGVGIRKKGIRKADRNGTNYGKFAVNKDDYFDDKGKRFPESVVEFTNGDRTSEADHPTQKPLDLFRYLIKTYSNEGDMVFDGYSGSGTTAVACHLENRGGVFCENDTENGYFFDSVKRLNEISSQKSLFVA